MKLKVVLNDDYSPFFFLFYIEMMPKLKVVLGNSIVMITKLKVVTIDFFFKSIAQDLYKKI